MPEAMLPILLIAVVVVVIVGSMFYSSQAAKKRRAAVEELAEQMGLTFLDDATDDTLPVYANFNLFGQGRAKKVANMIEGVTDEVRLRIFDYQYTVGSGKNQRTHRQTVASLSSSRLNCPSFFMRPEGFLDRIGGALGFQDIDFDSHQVFSDAFVLKGPDETAVREFFQPKILEFFEQRTGVCVEGLGQTMCFYRNSKIVKPEELKVLLADAYEVFGCFVDA